MSIHKIKKNLKRYGFKAIRAARLHKQIELLDKEALLYVNDINAFFANRKESWALEQQLIRMAR